MLVWGAGVESALSASLDEADWDAVAGAEASSESDTFLELEASSEPDAPSDSIVDPGSVTVSMRSSSY